MVFDRFCLSSYLAFRYVADPSAEWCPGVRPRAAEEEAPPQHAVGTARGLVEALERSVAALPREPVGLLLSGGIDSAILGALLPRGTPAYTLRFRAEGALDESAQAAVYAGRTGLEHRVVDATWDAYLEVMDGLMTHKRSPLHAVEPALFLAARQAARDGVRLLVVGNGADSTFGGLDKLLSRDWGYAEFMARYTFLEPVRALAQPVPVSQVYAPYRRGEGVDVSGFLKEVHGRGIIQAFANAVACAGCRTAQPYEELKLEGALDLPRIRRGESKYLVREAFGLLYPGLAPAEKVAFARPMDRWLADWTGPTRPEFLPHLRMDAFTGEQRWLLFCLERFLHLFDGSGRA